jgi:molecular chaperone DnaJ
MSKRDYYDVLGIARTANKDEVKRAYRRLARQYHPDVNKEAGADEQFKEINEAYEVLGDDDKRAAYDRYGHAAFQGAAGGANYQDFAHMGNMADIFEEFFGGFSGGGRRRSSGRAGADLRYDLEISFEESVFGTEKVIDVTRPHTCGTCQGTGSEPGSTPKRCNTCNGRGEVRRVQQSVLGQFVNVSACPTCHGTGEIITTPCHECHGRKQVQQTKKLKVNIPAGIDDQMQIRLANEGVPGTNGGAHGHLYVMVHVKEHAYFQRQGNDIYLTLDINIAQAALGDEIMVPSVDGDEPLVIPRGTQSGKKFTLKGKGVPILQRQGRGDQHVVIQVKIPEHLTQEQEELFNKLAGTLSNKLVIPQKEKGFLSSLKESLREVFDM